MKYAYCFLLTILILITTSCGTYTRVISWKTKRVVKKIARSDGYYSQYVGYAGRSSAEYKNYEKLLEIASEEELRFLVSHENPIVRSYVSLALSNRLTSEEFFPIVVSRLHDTARVETLNGCIGGVNIVGDVFVENFRTKANVYPKLDSLLFYSDYPIYSDDNARYANRYFKTDASVAIPFLENRADSGDIVSMKALLKSGNIKYFRFLDSLYERSSAAYLVSLSNFKINERHMSNLERLCLDARLHSGGFYSEWRKLYEYVSRYQNAWAVELLSMPLDSVANPDIQIYHARFIGDGIEKNNSLVFDRIAYTLWQKYKIVSKRHLEYMVKYYPDRVSLFIEIGRNYEEIEIAGERHNPEGKVSLFSELMRLDEKEGNDNLNRMIMQCSIHDFQEVVRFIDERNIGLLKVGIIKVLAEQNNIYYHFSLLERLAALEIGELDKEHIRNAFESNVGIKGSWGYEKAQELLEILLK